MSNDNLKTIKVPPDAHALASDHCKNRRVPLNLGAWVAQAIREQIEREKPKEESICQS